MRLKHFFILSLLAFAIVETVFIAASTSFVLIIDRSAEKQSTLRDFDKLFSTHQTEIVGNLMLGHTELLFEQLRRIALKDNLQIELTSGASVIKVNPIDGDESISKSFALIQGNKQYGELTLKRIPQPFPMDRIGALLLFVLLQVFIFGLLIHIAYSWSLRHIITPLEEVAKNAESGMPTQLKKDDRWTPLELKDLAKQLTQLWNDFRRESEHAAIGKISSQVAHDIRSPVMALNIAVSSLDAIPEERRLLFRSAIQRIEDIANNLRTRNEKSPVSPDVISNEAFSTRMLSLEVESILSEKREKFKFERHIEIKSALASSYGLFVQVQPALLKRVLSNLIDNAVESLPQKRGTVEIVIAESNDRHEVVIIDTGSGIPEQILPKLMVFGASFGKKNGSGLGLYQAKQAMQRWNGAIHLESKVGKGTTVTLSFPKAPKPGWFVPSIQISEQADIVILDDDPTIHETWKQRLANKLQLGQRIFSTYCPKEFSRIATTLKSEARHFVCLCDQELIGYTETGLDLIQTYRLEHNSILVTSHANESSVSLKCDRMGVKLMPKSLASYIPISFVGRGGTHE